MAIAISDFTIIQAESNGSTPAETDAIAATVTERKISVLGPLKVPLAEPISLSLPYPILRNACASRVTEAAPTIAAGRQADRMGKKVGVRQLAGKLHSEIST